jgi:tetratricopeptide (TPR) repeat protein
MRKTTYRVGLATGLVAGLGGPGAAAQEHQHNAAQPVASAETPAGAQTPLYDNLGTLHMTITTRSPIAQRYFDQGLRLTYGFNHAEAINSFAEGTRQDSTCAMCWWGIAYALGPNINLPMDTAAVRPAWAALQQALKYSAKVTPRERAYIQALSRRYTGDPTAPRPPLDSAYAKAMGEVSKRYPADDDAGTLYAEALMDLRPWRYWTNAGRPQAPSTLTQLAVLQRVVERNPRHPGACHFYIHAIEASTQAVKALPCANRLASLVPGAGHLVHMPSHIYLRLGMWEEAVDHNQTAVAVDEKFIQDRHPTGVYPIGYYPHNWHMMLSALQQLGRGKEAVAAGRKIAEIVPVDVMRRIPPLEAYGPVAVLALARFSRWDEILKEPAPPADMRYSGGIWHYARGLAYAETRRLDSAKSEGMMLGTIIDSVSPEDPMGQNSKRAVLQIAAKHLAGVIAAREGRTDEAIRALKQGIALEDELTYDEPPDWPLPLRQPLGEVLLAAGRPKEAEAAYRQDLTRYPNNGWSLHGLAVALRAEGRTAEAGAAEAQFHKIWSRADAALPAASF